MKKICLALFFAVLSCNVFGQDWLSLFIGSASKYASVELSDYRKRLSMEYNVGSNELDDYYRRCGNNWGNVGLALEIAQTSEKNEQCLRLLQTLSQTELEPYSVGNRHQTRFFLL